MKTFSKSLEWMLGQLTLLHHLKTIMCHEDKIKYQQLFTARQDLYFWEQYFESSIKVVSSTNPLYYSMRFSCTVVTPLYMINQQTTSPLKNRPRCYAKSPTVQDTFQPIPGLTSCGEVTEMGTAISCAECSQMSGFIQNFGRDTLKAPCLRATVLCAAVFHLKIVCSDRDQVLAVCKQMHINKIH